MVCVVGVFGKSDYIQRDNKAKFVDHLVQRDAFKIRDDKQSHKVRAALDPVINLIEVAQASFFLFSRLTSKDITTFTLGGCFSTSGMFLTAISS